MARYVTSIPLPLIFSSGRQISPSQFSCRSDLSQALAAVQDRQAFLPSHVLPLDSGGGSVVLLDAVDDPACHGFFAVLVLGCRGILEIRLDLLAAVFRYELFDTFRQYAMLRELCNQNPIFFKGPQCFGRPILRSGLEKLGLPKSLKLLLRCRLGRLCGCGLLRNWQRSFFLQLKPEYKLGLSETKPIRYQ